MYPQKFAGNEDAVVNHGNDISEILKNELGMAGYADEYNFENDSKDESLKKLLQSYSAFKTNSQNDIEKWNLELMVEDLDANHFLARENAAVIYKEAQKVIYHHAENHPELTSLTEVIFLFLHDLLHQVKKEEVFLSDIRQIAKNKWRLLPPVYTGLQEWKNNINLLQNSVDESLNYLKLIRRLTLNYRIPPGASRTYVSLFEKLKRLEDLLTLHFHLEKKILFPMAITLAEKKRSKINILKFLGL